MRSLQVVIRFRKELQEKFYAEEDSEPLKLNNSEAMNWAMAIEKVVEREFEMLVNIINNISRIVEDSKDEYLKKHVEVLINILKDEEQQDVVEFTKSLGWSEHDEHSYEKLQNMYEVMRTRHGSSP